MFFNTITAFVSIKTYSVNNQWLLYSWFIEARIRPEQSVNEEDMSVPLAVGHTVHSVCMCVDCSQLLNINLKVKGRELFDIRAGCWSSTHAASFTGSLGHCVCLCSPLSALMCRLHTSSQTCSICSCLEVWYWLNTETA